MNEASPERVIDPVCGMTVDPRSAKGSSEFEGHPYHFCSASCKRRFDENPAAYIAPKPTQVTTIATATMIQP